MTTNEWRSVKLDKKNVKIVIFGKDVFESWRGWKSPTPGNLKDLLSNKEKMKKIAEWLKGLAWSQEALANNKPQTRAMKNSIDWHPLIKFLAYMCDEKEWWQGSVPQMKEYTPANLCEHLAASEAPSREEKP